MRSLSRCVSLRWPSSWIWLVTVSTVDRQKHASSQRNQGLVFSDYEICSGLLSFTLVIWSFSFIIFAVVLCQIRFTWSKWMWQDNAAEMCHWPTEGRWRFRSDTWQTSGISWTSCSRESSRLYASGITRCLNMSFIDIRIYEARVWSHRFSFFLMLIHFCKRFTGVFCFFCPVSRKVLKKALSKSLSVTVFWLRHATVNFTCAVAEVFIDSSLVQRDLYLPL